MIDQCLMKKDDVSQHGTHSLTHSLTHSPTHSLTRIFIHIYSTVLLSQSLINRSNAYEIGGIEAANEAERLEIQNIRKEKDEAGVWLAIH